LTNQKKRVAQEINRSKCKDKMRNKGKDIRKNWEILNKKS